LSAAALWPHCLGMFITQRLMAWWIRPCGTTRGRLKWN